MKDEIPSNWVLTKVGDIYSVIGGGTPSTSIESYWNGEIPWISSADIYGIKDIRPRRRITEEAIKNSATNLIPKGSIIIVTRVGLGKVAIAPYPLCFSQDSQALVANHNLIDPLYSVYYLSQAVQQFKRQHQGTTISGVTKKQVKEVLFPLPPLEEQHRIITHVEQLFTQIDNANQYLQKMGKNVDLVDLLKISILKEAFVGKLIEQNPSEEPALKLLEKIKVLQSSKNAFHMQRRLP